MYTFLSEKSVYGTLREHLVATKFIGLPLHHLHHLHHLNRLHRLHRLHCLHRLHRYTHPLIPSSLVFYLTPGRIQAPPAEALASALPLAGVIAKLAGALPPGYDWRHRAAAQTAAGGEC